MNDLAATVERLLDGPLHSLHGRLSSAIRAASAGRFVIEVDDCNTFDIALWAERTDCAVDVPSSSQTITGWPGPDQPLEVHFVQGWRRFHWQGADYDAIQVAWDKTLGETTTVLWLIGDDEAALGALALDIAQVTASLHESILVFDGGCWARDPALFTAIQVTSLESLVLADGLAERIVREVRAFLGAKETFGAAGIAWRRGILLTGPPGNGKTHFVRGLLRELGLPTLYVRAFEKRYRTSTEEGIKAVYRRARVLQPCIVVLEDLDSLVDEGARSYLLNELDGLVDNTGVITLATTNYPERLDPALIDRPSRFDRKYTFALPELAERARWLATAPTGTAPPLDVRTVEALAAETGGFSFATLKELLVAGMLTWIEAGSSGSLDLHVQAQLAPLKAQLRG